VVWYRVLSMSRGLSLTTRLCPSLVPRRGLGMRFTLHILQYVKRRGWDPGMGLGPGNEASLPRVNV